MSVLRQTFLRQTTASFPNAAATTVDILGPESTTADPYAEGTDHVVAPRQVRQNEAGWAVVDLPTGLEAANIFLRGVEIWSRQVQAVQSGLSAALFPSGATAGGTSPVLKRVVFSSTANDTPTNGTNVVAILGGTLNTTATLSLPRLHVRADEFIRVTLFNNSGAPINNAVITTKFDLGLNPASSDILN